MTTSSEPKDSQTAEQPQHIGVHFDHAEGAIIAGGVDTGGGDFAGRDLDKSTVIYQRFSTEEVSALEKLMKGWRDFSCIEW